MNQKIGFFSIVAVMTIVAGHLFAAVSASASVPVTYDFSKETVGAAPASFIPVVGLWSIETDVDNRVLVVDGSRWKVDKAVVDVVARVRALYGEGYAEFLDKLPAYAHFSYAVAKDVGDFREGEISLRFKPMAGKVDQAAGILFDLKPNGDYLVLRANALENNLVLFQFKQGKRSAVKWIKDTPTPTRQWHNLRLIVKGKQVEGWLNGKLYLQANLEELVSGKVGVWSKGDSVVYFDNFAVKPGG